MSESATIIVRIDPVGDEESVQRIIDRVRDDLVANRIIVPNGERDPIRHPSEWNPGPAAASVTTDAQSRRCVNDGVDLVGSVQVHHSGGNYEPPSCPACLQAIDSAVYLDLVEQWLDGPEPLVRCTHCHADRFIGDWPGPWAFAVGAPAVRFNNWPSLSDTFVARVTHLLGGRVRVVHQHM